MSCEEKGELRSREETLRRRPYLRHSEFFKFVGPEEFDPHRYTLFRYTHTPPRSPLFYSGQCFTRCTNVTRHTPIESLHTALLGYGKMVAELVYGPWKDSAAHTFKLHQAWAFLREMNWSAYGRKIQAKPFFFRSHLGRDYRFVLQSIVYVLAILQPPNAARPQTQELWDVVVSFCKVCTLWIHGPAFTSITLVSMCHTQFSRLMYRNQVPEGEDNDTIVAAEELEQRVKEADNNAIKKLRRRPKMHLPVHVSDQQDKFGPLKLAATETDESLVGKTKMRISKSNRRDLSKQIAAKEVEVMSLQHIWAGGHDPSDPMHPVIAGKKLLDLVHNDPMLRRVANLPPLQPKEKPHGSLQKAMRNKTSKRPIRVTFRSIAPNLTLVARLWERVVRTTRFLWCGEHDPCG